ncbi:MAG: hypothetical protein K2M06_07425 [Muribaculaceae bacterium]|nr:hypothetical protein [Muribaculaceae bacterium]
MNRKVILVMLMGFACVCGAFAGNRLSTRTGSMDAPEGYTYNKGISDHMNMEVYSPADARGGIAFGVQESQGDITPSAMATVLANALMQDGVHTTMTTKDGTPVHVVTSKDGETVLAIAGDRRDKAYTVVIFRGSAASQAQALLKTFKKK